MSKGLFIGNVNYGNVYPTFDLVRGLVDRGETIIYYSSGKYQKEIESTGAIFAELPDEKTEDQTQSVWKRMYGIDEMVQHAGAILEGNRRILPHLMMEVSQKNPDYIIHDALCYAGKIIAKTYNIPSISSIPTFALHPEIIKREPAYFVSNILNLSLDSSATLVLLKSLDRFIQKTSSYLGQLYQIPDFHIMDAFMAWENLNVVYTSRYFQCFGDMFDNTYIFTGPCFSCQREHTDFPFDRLNGSPLIYISLGTLYNYNVDFFQKCIHAFGHKEWQIVMSIGKKTQLSELGDIPPNFIVQPFVPQLEILKRADLFITHGGMNSVSEGLYYGVPVVVIPQGYDQYFVAHRVEELNAGIAFLSQQFDADQLRNTAEKVLDNDFYRRNGRMIGDSFRESEGVENSVARILAYKDSFR